jgi:hypothetical protein
MYTHIVEFAYIGYDVYTELKGGRLVGVEVEHIAEGTVCERGAEYWDIVLYRSVMNTRPRPYRYRVEWCLSQYMTNGAQMKRGVLRMGIRLTL